MFFSMANLQTSGSICLVINYESCLSGSAVLCLTRQCVDPISMQCSPV